MNSSERGFTVIEMLVAISLSGIVGALATTVIVQGFHQQAATDARAAAVSNVRTAFQRTMRELREAHLEAVGDNSLTLQEDTTQRALVYQLQTANGVTSLVVSVNGATPTVVVSHVINDATQPVFSVFPVSGYPNATGTVNASNCVISGQTPTAYAPDCVGRITVNLRVMPTDAGGHPLCAATGGCVINVSDDADVRNNP